MEEQQRQNVRKVNKKTFEPGRQKVLIVNDDVTTFDFVIRMLMEVFFKSFEEAQCLAIDTDKNGRAVVGIYPPDIARSKAELGMTMARNENFPLRIITENA